MNELRLAWEPENQTPLPLIEERLRGYMRGKSGGVTLLTNGTLLFTPSGRDNEENVRRAMEEARFLPDFRVVPLKEGGYLVAFHHALGVFVGEDEFKTVRSDVLQRLSELKFPGEEFLSAAVGSQGDHLLVGLYARGKLQRDAYNLEFYKRIESVP